DGLGDNVGGVWRIRPGGQGVIAQAIANALGISVEEYDAAVETAREQVINRAVANGLLTQEQADRILERIEAGFGPGMKGFGPAPKGHRMGGWIGGPENSLVAIAADQLGLSVDELVAELQTGKSIAELAEEKGVEVQTIVDAIVAPRAEKLAEAVANGRITQEQADRMLSHMEEMVQNRLSEPFSFDRQRSGDFWRSGLRPDRSGHFHGRGRW
ncbi:MAG TPA: hypothetical protein EYP04_04985, partial [Anaerolineae bacterium]|nr:hypothetical protein [Anaerolineae bacterium]